MKEHFMMLIGMAIVLVGLMGLFEVDNFLEIFYILLLLGIGSLLMGISQYLYYGQTQINSSEVEK